MTMTRPKFSEYQEAIFSFGERGRGNAVVEATAGSGKTTTLVELATRLRRQRPQSSLLFCAFNKSIAEELSKRLPDGAKASTIHGLGFGALSKGLPMKPGRPDQWKYSQLVKELLEQRNIRPRRHDAYAEISDAAKDIISMTQANLTFWEDFDELEAVADACDIEIPKGHHGTVLEVVQEALRRGIELAQDRAVIDFTDMIWLPHELRLTPFQYDVVLVDECQDLNRAQQELVLKAVKRQGRIFFVGDRMQAIYGWAGADRKSIDRIVERTGADVLPLAISYRCPENHISLARTTGARIEPRPGAPTGGLGEISETEFMRLAQPGDMVLCRTTRPLIAKAFEFIRAGRPAQIRGRDIGQGLVRTVKAVAKDVEPFDADDFLEALEVYRGEKIDEAIRKAGGNEDAAEARIAQIHDRVDVLVLILEETRPQSLQQYVDGIERLFDDEPGRAVVFSTIHKAKGLECDTVFIIEPGQLPHPMARTPADKEGEAAVEFVALTRAKKNLWFVGEYARYRRWQDQQAGLN